MSYRPYPSFKKPISYSSRHHVTQSYKPPVVRGYGTRSPYQTGSGVIDRNKGVFNVSSSLNSGLSVSTENTTDGKIQSVSVNAGSGIAIAGNNTVAVSLGFGLGVNVSNQIYVINPVYALTLEGAGAAAPTVKRWTGPGTVTMSRGSIAGNYTVTFSAVTLSSNSCFVGTVYYPNSGVNPYLIYQFPPIDTSTSFSFGMGTPTGYYDLDTGNQCSWMICP